MKYKLLIAGMIFLAACKTNKETTKDTKPPVAETPKPATPECGTKGLSFSEIKPILEQNCLRCHGDMNQYVNVKNMASEGSLLASIKHQWGYQPMPKNADQLPQASIDLIECWIKNGMKE
jgi:hypothetical protein